MDFFHLKIGSNKINYTNLHLAPEIIFVNFNPLKIQVCEKSSITVTFFRVESQVFYPRGLICALISCGTLKIFPHPSRTEPFTVRQQTKPFG